MNNSLIIQQIMNLNIFKSNVFCTGSELERHRLYVNEEQLIDYWNSLTLIEMEKVITLRDQRIIFYINEYLSYYLREKKVTPSDAYQIKNNDTSIICIYDCKLFKTNYFTKEINQMFSSFLVASKVISTVQLSQLQDLYEFYDNRVFSQANIILKCKASSIPKIYSVIKSAIQSPIEGDTIILTHQYYFQFLVNWMSYVSYPSNFNVEAMVQRFFRGIMILFQNSILLEFAATLSSQQKQIRRYNKPVNIIMKPKLLSSSTMIEKGLGQVQWHTLKIDAFKLKYKVIEKETFYECYRIKKNEQQEEDIEYDPNFMEEGDQTILQMFKMLRLRWMPDYY